VQTFLGNIAGSGFAYFYKLEFAGNGEATGGSGLRDSTRRSLVQHLLNSAPTVRNLKNQ
jgi:hypothetical protein